MFGFGNSNEIEVLDNYFKEFVNFVQLKQNRIEKRELKYSAKTNAILESWNKQVDETAQSLQNDTQIMGEVVLLTDKMEQGIFGCRIHGKTKNPLINSLKINVNKMADEIEKDIKNLKIIMEQYTHDDFTNKIDINPNLKADMLAVMQGVNSLGNALSNSAKSNLTNGQHLESNSSTMKDSVENLANKANQQAASLEETAAAVEEITSITRNNANNTAKMSDLGTKVQSSVSTGMTLANKTSEAMDSINQQVTAILESITVIDQIAFQTNILSLNAAVEAATAGEAGKGFAVVAQEVRNLASRSADAANEIKTLVDSASIKANEGKKVSDEMIKGYEELNDNATQTINLIEDVSVASKEQMTGIEQINDAVTMLDRVTQENAHEASSVAQIASEVSQMANELVAEASAKKF